MIRSPAYSFIKERVDLEFKKLDKEKVTPWAFFLSGKELRLTDFLSKVVGKGKGTGKGDGERGRRF